MSAPAPPPTRAVPARITGVSSAGPAYPATNATEKVTIVPSPHEMSEAVAAKVMAQLGPQVTQIALNVADKVASRVADRVATAVAARVAASVTGRINDRLAH